MQSDKMVYSYRTDNIKHERDCRVSNYEEWNVIRVSRAITIYHIYFVTSPAIRSPITVIMQNVDSDQRWFRSQFLYARHFFFPLFSLFLFFFLTSSFFLFLSF